MNSWVVLLVAVFVLSVGATPLSQQLCGTRGRSTGISGGLCKNILESLNGDLPACPNDDATIENALAIFDFFSDDSLLEQNPAAAKLMDRVMVCADVGTTWNANMSLYTIPGWTGPCNDKSFAEGGYGSGSQGPFLGFKPCVLANMLPGSVETQYCDATSDSYQWWAAYMTYYGPKYLGHIYNVDLSGYDRSTNPDCLDPQLGADDAIFNTRAWYGGRPYCSFFSDLAPEGPSCSEVARFRPVGTAVAATSIDDRFVTNPGNPNDDPLNDFTGAEVPYVFNGTYVWEYCAKPYTVLNPWVANRWELVACYEWLKCDNWDYLNTTFESWGYQDWLANGSFPVCNPCNCDGVGSPGSTHKRDGPARRNSCGNGEGSPGSTHTAGSPGSSHTAGSPGSTHTVGGAFGNCGGQGSPGSTHTAGSPGSTHSFRDEFSTVTPKRTSTTAAEIFELIAQLHIETALQAEQPLQEILGRMCSCACGPAF